MTTINKYTIQEWEQIIAKEDGISYSYIEGDMTIPFNEVLSHVIECNAEMLELTENETSELVNSINIDNIKHIAESDIKQWFIKYSDMTKEDIKEDFSIIMKSFHGENTKRYEVAIKLFFGFLDSYYQ